MQFNAIPFLKGYSEFRPIHEGYSGDKKYIVVKDGKNYLLRTFEVSLFAEKEKEYAVLKKMIELQVRCSRPLEIGYMPEHKEAYMVLTYIEGEDCAKALPMLSQDEQYKIGFEAGQELQKIDSLEAPSMTLSWYDRKFAKHQRYLSQYLSGDIRIEGEAKIIEFIESHIYLMKGRPNFFQHDDFHIRNLIVKDQSLSGVIDFNRHDWGDPIHEFLKVGQFSSEISIPFSIGQFKGFLNGENPNEEFWRLYSL